MKRQKAHRVHSDDPLAGIGKPQKRVLLEWLGVSIRHQPRKIDEMDQMISLARSQDPEHFQRAIDAVILRKVNTDAPVKMVDLSDVVQLVTEHVSEVNATSVGSAIATYEAKIADHTRQVAIAAEIAIQAAAEKYITVRYEVSCNKQPAVKLDGNAILPECFPRMLKLAAARKNIMLVGPAGCGKTHIAAVLAKALSLDYASQSCSAGVSESSFTGWLIPIKNGEFVHVPAEFIRVYEHGGVFLIDEIDASDPNVLVFINQALANDHFFLPQRFNKTKVVKHKDFIAIAAANTIGTGPDAMYTARNALDEATRDRFRIGMIIMGYSPAVEEKIVDKDVLEWGRKIRAIIETHRMRKLLSTRVMKDATDMIRGQGWTMDDVREAYYADWSPEEKRIVLTANGGAL